MTTTNFSAINSQLIVNQKAINKIQDDLTDTNKNLLITINNTLTSFCKNLIIEVGGVITIDKKDCLYRTRIYQENLSDNHRLIIRNRRLIEINDLFITKKEILFISNQEIAEKSRGLFFKNQNLTLNNLELIKTNHSLIAMNLLPPIIFPKIPKKSREAIHSTLERIVISSQLLILSRISTRC